MGPGDPASIAHVVRADGKECHTEYHVLETVGTSSLLRIGLHTGRQHQIRVHASHHGCPLIGDWVYGQPCVEVPGQALHAAVLAGHHPITGEAMRWEAPLPELFSSLWNTLRDGNPLTPSTHNPAQRLKLGLQEPVGDRRLSMTSEIKPDDRVYLRRARKSLVDKRIGRLACQNI